MQIFDSLKKQFLLGHSYGVPVRVDYRWFFVLALIAWLTAIDINSTIENYLTSFIFGLLAAILFFVSIFLHELAHAVMAQFEGMRVLEIVLHPFGGLTRFSREPETPRAEFRIAVAGPGASFLIALVFVALLAVSDWLGITVLSRICLLLFLLNLFLAVFNMFPGYPLDGGRVLRSYLWRRGADLNEATILTARCGQVIAVVLIIFGVLIALTRGDLFTGSWTILVGAFLLDSSKGIIGKAGKADTRKVEDAMTLPVTVEPNANVQDFVDKILSVHRRTVFLVAAEKELYGILMLEDFKSLPREKWRDTLIREVMRPITTEYFIESDAPLSEARMLIKENGIGALGVVDGEGRLVGFLKNETRRKRRRKLKKIRI